MALVDKVSWKGGVDTSDAVKEQIQALVDDGTIGVEGWAIVKSGVVEVKDIPISESARAANADIDVSEFGFSSNNDYILLVSLRQSESNGDPTAANWYKCQVITGKAVNTATTAKVYVKQHDGTSVIDVMHVNYAVIAKTAAIVGSGGGSYDDTALSNRVSALETASSDVSTALADKADQSTVTDLQSQMDNLTNGNIVRVEKVLFEGSADTVDAKYDLNGNVTDYDEIIVCGRAENTTGTRTVGDECRISDIELVRNYTISYFTYSSGETAISTGWDVIFSFDTASQLTLRSSAITGKLKDSRIYKVVGIKYVNPNSYSTDEKVVGNWIDGKPLYQKTINFGALPNNTTKEVGHNISNLDKIVRIDGIMHNPTGTAAMLPYVNVYTTTGGSINIFTRTNTIVVQTDMDRTSWSAYVTLTYTKTTD